MKIKKSFIWRAALAAFLCLGLIATAEETRPEKETTEPKLLKKGTFNYPKSLASKNIYNGYAEVIFMLSPKGKPYDVVVLETNHPLIGEAIRKTLPKCEYSPKMVYGEPQSARLGPVQMSVSYEKDSSVMDQLDFTTNRMDITKTEYHYKIPAINKLDAMPKPVEQFSPGYPESLIEEGIEGNVVVDFFIDPEGKVRCPGIHKSLHPEIDAAAYNAVQQWKYEPPMKDGKPSWTRARLPMRFTPPPQEEPAEETE